MPAVLGYPLDQTSDTARALDEAFAKEADSRRAVFALRWQYYQGIMRKPLAPQADGVDDNVLMPKVGQVIDKVVSFLLGDGIEFDASTEEGESDPTDELLETIWRENRGDDTQHRLAMFGAICGHVFARVEPREGLPPRITALNPDGISVFWDAFDQSRVLWYRLQHRLGEGGQGKRVDYVRGADAGAAWDHDAEGWTEIVYTIPTNGQRWQRGTEQRIPYCPIVDWQNLSNAVDFYGQDDASAVLALNDALNFAASNYSRILKHYGTPKTIGLGFSVEEDVKQGAGDLVTINKPRSEADVKYLEMTGDLASVRDWIALLSGEIWQAARMPDPQNLKDKVGALTNFGIRLMYNDALHKTADKRTLYGEGFERINKLALSLSGATVPESIEVVWPDPLPVDETAQVAALSADLAAKAISVQTYAETRGYDWEREQARIEEESAGQDDLGTRLLAAFDRGNVTPMPRPAIQGGENGTAEEGQAGDRTA